jgi:hypothetical protein
MIWASLLFSQENKKVRNLYNLEHYVTGLSGRAVQGVGLRPLAC